MKLKKCKKETSATVIDEYGLNRVPEEMKDVFKASENSRLTLREQTEAMKKWRAHIIEWRRCERPTFGETLEAILIFRGVKHTAFKNYGLTSKQVDRLIANDSEAPQLKSLVTIAATLDMPLQIFLWFIELAGIKYYTKEKEINHYLLLMDDHSRFKDISEYDLEMYENQFPTLAKPPKEKKKAK